MTSGCSCKHPSSSDSGESDSGQLDADTDSDHEPSDADNEIVGSPMTHVMCSFELLTDRLCDFDGDGVGDNAVADMGPLADIVASFVNSYWQRAFSEYNYRLLAHSPWIDDLATPHDPEAILIMLYGFDTDDPPDVSDDFSGSEPFSCEGKYLDLCGEPLFYFSNFQVTNGEILGHASKFDISVSSELEFILYNVTVMGTIEPMAQRAEYVMCGYIHPRDLGQTPGFLAPEWGLNFLEELISAGSILDFPDIGGFMLDVDVDGDGIETLIANEVTLEIASCIDGNGIPVGEELGRDCWQDERIADGFSMVTSGEAVSVRYMGRRPGWEASATEPCDGGPPDSSLFDPR